jgi:hypothetical protein
LPAGRPRAVAEEGTMLVTARRARELMALERNPLARADARSAAALGQGDACQTPEDEDQRSC